MDSRCLFINLTRQINFLKEKLCYPLTFQYGKHRDTALARKTSLRAREMAPHMLTVLAAHNL